MTALLRFDPSAPDVAGFFENQNNDSEGSGAIYLGLGY